jgi:hypothetical protein
MDKKTKESEVLEARLSKVEAIQEITNLQARYAYIIDTKQEKKVPDLFAANFIAEYDYMGTYKTKAELAAFLAASNAASPMFKHQMQTPLIEVDGDNAKGTWYLFCPFTVTYPEGPVAGWAQGKYENDYVKEGGKWKFKHLRFKFTFMTPYEDGWVKAPMKRFPGV